MLTVLVFGGVYIMHLCLDGFRLLKIVALLSILPEASLPHVGHEKLVSKINSHTWRWRWNKHVQRGYIFFEHVCRVPKTLLLWNAVFLQAHHTFKHQLLNLGLEYVATGLAMTSCLFRWVPCEKYMWLISHKPVLDTFHYSKIMAFGSSSTSKITWRTNILGVPVRRDSGGWGAYFLQRLLHQQEPRNGRSMNSWCIKIMGKRDLIFAEPQGGPLPLINGVITSISRGEITPVTHLQGHLQGYNW